MEQNKGFEEGGRRAMTGVNAAELARQVQELQDENARLRKCIEDAQEALAGKYSEVEPAS